MGINFCSIASGSSGNSIYVGNFNTNILIDAGVSGKAIQNELKKVCPSGSKINAIFVTHEHSDHIKGVGVLSRRFDIPVYATEGTWNAMENFIGKIDQKNKKIVSKQKDCSIGSLSIHAYEIPHDAAEPVGYSVTDGKSKVTIATDIGHITDTVKNNIMYSDALLIEANHDINMLKIGRYPYYLKRRILSDLGHLSNESCGDILAKIFNSKLKYILLGHLSAENNFPELAFKTVLNSLNLNKIEVGTYLKMSTAPRYECSEIINV